MGEIVRRITGRSLGEFFAEEVAKPLGADFHIGLPTEHDHRVAPLIPPPSMTDEYADSAPLGPDGTHRKIPWQEVFRGDDRVLGTPMCWTVGFGMFGNTFGWGGSLVVSDPCSRMTVACVMNQMIDRDRQEDNRGMEDRDGCLQRTALTPRSSRGPDPSPPGAPGPP